MNAAKLGLVATVGFALGLTLNATADTDTAAGDAAVTHVESILGYTPDVNGINFQVNSGGCTKKEDFRVQIEKRSATTAQLTLLRMRPDSCQSFVPTGERIYMSYDEMKLNPTVPYVIGNPNGMVKSWVWKK